MSNSTGSNQRYETVVGYKISDLILATRIEEICRAKGKRFARTGSLGALEVTLHENNLVVCDLILVSNELELLKKVANERGCRVFGYYPHVDKNTETLARSTGIDFVVPRSAMQGKLRSILN